MFDEKLCCIIFAVWFTVLNFLTFLVRIHVFQENISRNSERLHINDCTKKKLYDGTCSEYVVCLDFHPRIHASRAKISTPFKAGSCNRLWTIYSWPLHRGLILIDNLKHIVSRSWFCCPWQHSIHNAS